VLILNYYDSIHKIDKTKKEILQEVRILNRRLRRERRRIQYCNTDKEARRTDFGEGYLIKKKPTKQ
jgi:hypothetical protein